MRSFIKNILASLVPLDWQRGESIQDEHLQEFQPEDKSLVLTNFASHTVEQGDKFQVPGISLGIVKRCYCFGEQATVITTKGFLMEHLMLNLKALKKLSRKNLIKGILLSYSTPLPLAKKSERALILSTQWDINYYHWTIEVLPKLLYVKDYVLKEQLPIVVSPTTASFIQQWKNELGGITCLFVESKKETVFYEEALIFRFHRLKGRSHTASLNLLRNFVNQRFSDALPKLQLPTRKLYITRADARMRRVKNEDEVKQLLSEHGYETVTLTNLTILEQIKLFRSAHSIVAPHGAGLANLIFSAQGQKVIEFLPNQDPVICYVALSWDLGHNHIVQYCDMQDGDFLVDLTQLRKSLAA